MVLPKDPTRRAIFERIAELEHRHLDRHGPGWEQVRDGVGGDLGWPLYLERFAEELQS